MSRIFQITGYPRSGTAWLTTMFNLAPEVMAYHELALHDLNWRSTISERAAFGRIVFDIGTYQYFPKAVIANCRKIFINQDPNKAQIKVSLATGLKPHHETHLVWKRMAENWISEWNPMIIEYADLFDLDNLEKLWRYCLGDKGIEFPDKKVEQLLKFNIQLHEPAKALADPVVITRLAELI